MGLALVVVASVVAGTLALDGPTGPGPRTAAAEATGATAPALPAGAGTGTPVTPASVAPPGEPEPTPAPTTSTTVPPSPPTTAPPAPTTTLRPGLPADPGGSPEQRARAAFWGVIPSAWSDVLRFRIGVTSGRVSWSHTDGLVEFGQVHAGEPWPKLLFVAAHEAAHLMAIAFGAGDYLGQPPPGWVPSGPDPAERFADCVASALTGLALASHGLPPCTGPSLTSAAALVDRGPPVPR